jgi:purine-binding chemotaxis protein CheW
VLTINEKDISPPPSSGTGAGCRYLAGIGKVGGEVKLQLDCEALFSADEESTLTKISEGKIK